MSVADEYEGVSHPLVKSERRMVRSLPALAKAEWEEHVQAQRDAQNREWFRQQQERREASKARLQADAKQRYQESKRVQEEILRQKTESHDADEAFKYTLRKQELAKKAAEKEKVRQADQTAQAHAALSKAEEEMIIRRKNEVTLANEKREAENAAWLAAKKRDWADEARRRTQMAEEEAARLRKEKAERDEAWRQRTEEYNARKEFESHQAQRAQQRYLDRSQAARERSQQDADRREFTRQQDALKRAAADKAQLDFVQKQLDEFYSALQDEGNRERERRRAQLPAARERLCWACVCIGAVVRVTTRGRDSVDPRDRG